MTTVTIPKEALGKKELVAIPRDFYEEFLRWRGKLRNVKEFPLTPAEKRDLARARKEYKQGNSLAFNELKRKLDIAG